MKSINSSSRNELIDSIIEEKAYKEVDEIGQHETKGDDQEMMREEDEHLSEEDESPLLKVRKQFSL